MKGHKSSSKSCISEKESEEETERAVLLLKNEGCSGRVVSHALAVSRLATDIAKRIKENGHDIDVDFVRKAAILHDIGRSKTNGIMHGIEGGRILCKRGFKEPYIRVCECHVGAGITMEEAEETGLPKKDYMPKTIEEKVIAHADNLLEGDKLVPIENTLKKLKEKLGENHPAIMRVSSLSKEIELLLTSKSALR